VGENVRATFVSEKKHPNDPNLFVKKISQSLGIHRIWLMEGVTQNPKTQGNVSLTQTFPRSKLHKQHGSHPWHDCEQL
jgi:hypothetical protein